MKVALWFEEEHKNTIRDYNFQCGTLSLMRNTAIEKALNRKMRLSSSLVAILAVRTCCVNSTALYLIAVVAF